VVRPTRVTNRIRALRFSSGQMTQGELAGRVAVSLEEVFQYPGTGS
jgi:putative transcriptional regulator